SFAITGLPAVAPGIHRGAVEEIVVAKGVVVAGEEARRIRLVVEQVDGALKIPAVLQLAAAEGGSRGFHGLLRPADRGFTVEHEAHEVRMIQRALQAEAERRS